MNYFTFIGKIDSFQQKYTIPIDKLVSLNIVVPDIQRDLDGERVDDIVKYQLEFLKKHNTLCFIGDITIALFDNTFFIIDGYHRFMSMKKVYLYNPEYIIGVNIITPNSHLSMEDVFLLINKSEPVPDYVIQTTLDNSKRKVIDEFSRLFMNEYKHFISKSKNPKRPCINVTTFLDKFNTSVIAKSLSNAQEMMNYIKYININKWKEIDKLHSIFCIDRAIKYNCSALFICCDADDRWIHNTEWIREFCQNLHITNNLPVITSDQDKNTHLMKKRKTLPKTIRSHVWQKVFQSNLNGACTCCNRLITYDTFECGHVISVKNNGTDTIENLVPICGLCNKSMGSHNMIDFCTSYSLPLNKNILGIA